MDTPVKAEEETNTEINTTTTAIEANTVLTYDVLLNLFNYLEEKSDLAQCSAVCSYWRKVASDPSFHWEMVMSLKCYDYNLRYSNFESKPHNGNFTIELVETDKYLDLPNVIVKSRDGTVIGKFRTYENQYIEFVSKMPRIWKAVPYVLKDEEQKKQLNIPDQALCKLEIAFNPKRFEQELKKVRGKEKEFLGFTEAVNFATIQNKKWVQEFTKRTFTEMRKPTLDEVEEQPDGLLDGVKLYNWMKNIETEPAEVEYVELIPWRVPDSTLHFTNKGDVVWSDRGLSEYTKKATPKGGVLADEMGLGKTLEMLGLILANPAENPSDELDEDPPKKEKYDLFYTPATLILCPSHLVKQWKGEVEKYLDPEMSVVTLTTIIELRATTYRDICDADIVIASYQVLKNPNYFRIGHHETLAPRNDEELKRPGWVRSQLGKVRGKTHKGALDSICPVLDHFNWHRLVLDEGHEILDIPFYYNTIGQYETENKWYMTGTPFSKGAQLMGRVLKFLEFPDTDAYSWVQYDPLLEKRFWRNTKASITDEYEIDVYSEDVFILDFTPIERLMYLDIGVKRRETWEYGHSSESFKERKKEFCAMTITSGNSLTESRSQFIRTITYRLQNTRSKIERATTEIGKIKAHIAAGNTNNYPYYSPQTQLAEYERYLVEYKRNIVDDERLEEDANATVPYAGPDLTKDVGMRTADEEEKAPVVEEEEEYLDDDEMSAQELKIELDKRHVEYAKGLSKGVLAKLLKQACKNPASIRKQQKRKAEELEDEEDDEEEEESEPKKRKTTRKKKAKKEDDEGSESDKKKKPKGKKAAIAKKEPVSNAKGKNAKKEEEENKITPTMIRNFLVEKLGTKVGSLIFFLKKLWKKDAQARIMIFSQYNTLLEKISDILFTFKINNAFIVGNVLQRNKALTQFKAADSNVKVIMLSLSNSASGTNLVECSHIILMDSLSGTKKEVTAIESQAIGRAYRQGQTRSIKVVRFLIKDTIEHEFYKQNHTNVKDVSTLVRTASSLVRADSSLGLEHILSNTSAIPMLTPTPSAATTSSNNNNNNTSTRDSTAAGHN